MTQGLSTLSPLPEDWSLVTAPTTRSQLPVMPVPRDLMTFCSLHEHHECTEYTYIPPGHTYIHIKWKINEYLFMFNPHTYTMALAYYWWSMNSPVNHYKTAEINATGHVLNNTN